MLNYHAERQKAEFSPSKAKFPDRIAPLKGGIAQGQIFFKFTFKIYFKAIYFMKNQSEKKKNLICEFKKVIET